MAARRASTRAMLAHVALVSDLPIPKVITFYSTGSLNLNFDLLSSASAWCKFLGGTALAASEHGGNRYFRHEYSIVWHGWRIDLSAYEPVKSAKPAAALPSDLTAELSSLVSSDQVAA